MKSQISRICRCEIGDQALVATTCQSSPSSGRASSASRIVRIVKRRGARQREQLVHRRIHLEAAPEAAQHDVAAGRGRRTGSWRSGTAAQSAAASASATGACRRTPCRRCRSRPRAPRANSARAARPARPRRPAAAASKSTGSRMYASTPGLEQLMLLEARDARMAIEHDLQQRRAGTRKPEQEHVAGGAVRAGVGGARPAHCARPTRRMAATSDSM